MAELKLSAVWKIKDFAKKNVQVKSNARVFDSDDLPELHHASLPGVHWEASLCTSLTNHFFLSKPKGGYASFNLCALFGSSRLAATYVWASYSATLLAAGERAVATHVGGGAQEFKPQDRHDMFDDKGVDDAFKLEDVSKAVQKDGSLSIRIDLTILNIGELLECRELVRGFLKREGDFNAKVDQETFQLNKCVMAGTSSVLAAMLDSGLGEAASGVLTLPDTTPAAFKAFSQAVYYENWDFLQDVDLTQEVLYLSEKYNVANLKRFCDKSLAEKVNEANALAILTNSAALCNAEMTKQACIDILAKHTEFKESDDWLDFKKQNREIALEIQDAVFDKLAASHKRLQRKRKREAPN